MKIKCSKCNTEILAGEEYTHQSNVLCEDCFLDIRTPRVRKTHWQYLRSKKTEYLIHGKRKQI
jgi:DNA-directed RNA polymerase subunit RPC12/RpoP